MASDFYGVKETHRLEGELEEHVESVRIKGFSVAPSLLSEEEVMELNARLEAVYEQQLKETPQDMLTEINDLNMARAPLLYDDTFLKLATNEKVLAFVRRFLGEYFILNLQNGIINRPSKEHHQTSWHRDLPYQYYTSSRPLSVNAFYCLCDFNSETGGTLVLPFSHREENLPSLDYLEKNELQVTAPAGSVIFFDSMLFHRAGTNSSNIIRRGINNMFCTAILKQQVDFATALDGKYSEDSFLRMFLGYESQTPVSVQDWRERRLAKMRGRAN